MTEVIDKDVYTLVGKHVGHITNLLLDVDTRSVSALEMKIKGGKGGSNSDIILVPYELVAAIGDIVLIGGKK